MQIQFNNLHDFLLMGQHGAYVWSAWLISIAVILLLIWNSIQARKQFYVQQQQALAIMAAKNKRCEM
jgi:heme exporter protein D